MENKTGLIHFVPEWKCVDDQPDTNRRLHYSRFALSPLLVDQAMTIGVALRRALLSEVEGISIVSGNIVGAVHEYSTLDGVRESVDEILLNLKQIVLKGDLSSRTPLSSSLRDPKGLRDSKGQRVLPTGPSAEEGQKEYRASIFAQGPGVVTAEHIKFPSSILAVDPDQPIATLLNETQLCIELFIKQGIAKQLNHNKVHHKGFFIDANFTPVQKANFSIHSVGDPKGLQQLLLLEIWTNKTLTPVEALYQAHASLLNLFHKTSPPIPSKNIFNFDADGPVRSSVRKKDDSSFDKLISLETKKDSIQSNNSTPSVRLKSYTDTNLSIEKQITDNLKKESLSIDEKQITDNLKKESLSIDELELSPRIYNCLKRANIHTIADLLSYTQEDLLKIKNFGRKSVEQVSVVLRKRFNMELLTTQ